MVKLAGCWERRIYEVPWVPWCVPSGKLSTMIKKRVQGRVSVSYLQGRRVEIILSNPGPGDWEHVEKVLESI